VLKGRSAGNRMRPWIAAVAAYVLALHVLLTGFAIGHSIALGNASENLFVICHGDGSSDKHDVRAKEPLAGSPCVFCTLAKAPCAILPTDHGVATSEATGISSAAVRTDSRIVEFHSPTGQYQRGPPISISILG
jgi:Protein of unknown function (DUF2946)